MRRVLISVEGQTEEIFVGEILAPHLSDFDVHVQQVILKTKRPAGAAAHRGGVSKWAKVDQELRMLLGDSDAVMVTTMYDLYGLPQDTPGREAISGIADGHARATAIESAIRKTIGDKRLRPYLQVHEFEALLFAAPSEVAARAGISTLEASISQVAASAGGPELVDDGPQTAPSKRMASLWPEFTKTLDGPAVTKAAGLSAIRDQCPHFARWLGELESLGS